MFRGILAYQPTGSWRGCGRKCRLAVVFPRVFKSFYLLGILRSHLLHLSPERVLDRGYSITETADGAIVRDSAQLTDEQELKVTLARGWAGVRVKRTG